MIGQIFLWVFSQSKIFSGAFRTSQFRPKNFFSASNNAGSPAGGGPPHQELLPRSKPEIATWLRSIIGWQSLHFACEADDEPMIMRLLCHGASPLAEANGITPNMLGSAATRRMVNEALVWKPSSHPLFPLSVRTVVRMVLLLRARCDQLGMIPIDVLCDAMGFLPR